MKHFSTPPCTTGNITGSVTLNIPVGFTGTTTFGDIIDFEGASNPGRGYSYANLSGASFTFSNGIMTQWAVDAAVSTDDIESHSWSEDSAETGWPVIYYGTKSVPPHGQWYGGQSLGSPCGRPGAASCGEPVDLGSGNVFEQVQDYSTVGQNPLALIRYYNSLAMPSTYEITLGSNWRTNYSRYLHWT